MAEESIPQDKWSVTGKKAEVESFLRRVASMPVVNRPAGRGRLIFAMDATASREPTWDRACRLQGEMFEATEALGGLDVQLVFYRGFSECRASRWLASAAELHRAMQSVGCVGGETQIARVLSHALKEARARKVQALVFIGDAVEEGIDRLCALAGRLGLLGVPVFLFHEGGDPVTARAFKEIARLTRGAYCPFDAGSALQLRALLGAVAVYVAGGRPALQSYGRRIGGTALLLADRMEHGS